MITLKTNPYNEKELKQLLRILVASEKLMQSHFCKGRNCKACEFRHLCYDLSHARNYAEKLVQESEI